MVPSRSSICVHPWLNCLRPLSSACETAGKFEWSSHSAYIGGVPISWLYTQELLGRFSQNGNRVRELYAYFVEQGVGEKRRKDFHHGSHLGQILGPDHFADMALKTADAGISKPKSIDEILTVVCEVYGVELKLMYELGNGRPCSELRAMAALIIQENEAITIT